MTSAPTTCAGGHTVRDDCDHQARSLSCCRVVRLTLDAAGTAAALHSEAMNDDVTNTLPSVNADGLSRVFGGAGGCAIVGDSIADGLAEKMPHCQRNAKIGIPSGKIIERVPQGYLGLLIISAGSNDPQNPRLADNLNAMRRRAGGGVIWIAPVDSRARSVVNSVAQAHGDRVVTFTPGRDHVHPRSYSEIAQQIQGGHH